MLKAAVQGAVAVLPASHRANELLQRMQGSLRLTEERFAFTYRMALRHVEAVERYGKGIGAARVLEVGTGSHPVVPIALMLRGAERVLTADITPLCSLSRVLEAINHFRALPPEEHRGWKPEARERLESAAVARHGSSEEALASLGVDSHIGRVSEIGLPLGAVDLIVTNSTLEHVPPLELVDMLRGFRRLAGSDAIASHYIDLTDHYSHFDSSIDAYNFLRYSDRAWRPFNNHLHYQNRLRAPDFRQLFTDAGWRIVAEDVERVSTHLSGPIASRFRRTDPEQLTISELYVVTSVSGP
ncbi:MAG: class I SAM-dependent methyltransferase [Chloroflexi bacterium]|nr:class I SAM-dependent methyltransferase [Chloroflexota bacterium]